MFDNIIVIEYKKERKKEIEKREKKKKRKTCVEPPKGVLSRVKIQYLAASHNNENKPFSFFVSISELNWSKKKKKNF